MPNILTGFKTAARTVLSTVYAVAGASPAVGILVDNMNTHIMTPAIKYKPWGEGTKRRAQREAKARLANAKHRAHVAALTKDKPASRQVERAYQRKIAKKMSAMIAQLPGGAAAVCG